MKYQGSDAWLAERREGIGSSDAPMISRVTRRGGPLKVYLDKIGEAPPETPDPGLEFFRKLGHALEPVIAQMFTERTGLVLRRRDRPVWEGGHRGRPGRHGYPMFASFDRVSPETIVELKSRRSGKGFGPDGSGLVPPDIEVQTQHQLEVVDERYMFVAVLIGGSDFRIFKITRDPGLLESVIDLEAALWDRVQRRDPPPADASKEATEWLNSRHSGDGDLEVPATPEVEVIMGNWQDAKSRAGAIEEEIDLAKNQIREWMGEAVAMSGPGFRVSYKRNKPTAKVDWQAVAQFVATGQGMDPAEFAQIVVDHTTVGQGQRPLVPTWYEEGE